MYSDDYLNMLGTLFRKHANPEKAEAMKKYLLNQFEFFGIQKPGRELIYKSVTGELGVPDLSEGKKIIKSLWMLPERENQHFAMIMLDNYTGEAGKDWIDFYAYLITKKSWWDTVDFLAIRPVGTHFRRFPELIPGYAKKWMNSGNIWLQRTCILFQLKYKSKTNTQLLSKFILELSDSKEFFIRKAIGWALREYSKTNPEWVRDFIEKQNLSTLSKREGLKWLNRKNQ